MIFPPITFVVKLNFTARYTLHGHMENKNLAPLFVSLYDIISRSSLEMRGMNKAAFVDLEQRVQPHSPFVLPLEPTAVPHTYGGASESERAAD